MMNRLSATLLYTGGMLLLLLSTIFVGQSIYYQFQLSMYSQNIQYNKAKVLYNMAMLNRLEKGKQMKTNIGTIKYEGDSYQVYLTSQQKYIFYVSKNSSSASE